MVATVSAASDQYHHSINTLKYADRAKEIKTHVVQNVGTVESHVADYQKIIGGAGGGVAGCWRGGGGAEGGGQAGWGVGWKRRGKGGTRLPVLKGKRKFRGTGIRACLAVGCYGVRVKREGWGAWVRVRGGLLAVAAPNGSPGHIA